MSNDTIKDLEAGIDICSLTCIRKRYMLKDLIDQPVP